MNLDLCQQALADEETFALCQYITNNNEGVAAPLRMDTARPLLMSTGRIKVENTHSHSLRWGFLFLLSFILYSSLLFVLPSISSVFPHLRFFSPTRFQSKSFSVPRLTPLTSDLSTLKSTNSVCVAESCPFTVILQPPKSVFNNFTLYQKNMRLFYFYCEN